jgi:hypothetical protein
MEKEALFKLTVVGTDKLAELNQAIEKNRKALKTGEDESAILAERRKVLLKQQQQQYRDLQKDILNRNKATKDGTKTLESMRAELSRLNAQSQKLDIGGKEFKAAQQRAKALRDEINGIDQEAGKFQGNVGNYKNAIVDAFQQMGVNIKGLTQPIQNITNVFNQFNKTINNVDNSINDYSQTINNNTLNVNKANKATEAMTASKKLLVKATGGVSKAMRVLKIALISTGIGAIVVAITGAVVLLVNALKSFDPVVDRIQQGVAALKAVFGSLSDTVLSVITGQKSLREAVSGAGEAMSKAAKTAIEYKKAQQELDDMVWKSTVNQAKYNNEVNELILQSKNRTLSEKERIALIDEALKIEEKAFAERKAIADQELMIAEKDIIAKNNLTDSEIKNLRERGVEYAISLKDFKSVTDEQVQTLVDALTKQEEIESQSISMREKAINRRDQLEDQAAEKDKKRQEERSKQQEERSKQLRVAAELEAKIYQDGINAIAEISKKWDEIIDKRTNPEQVLFPLFDEEEIEDIPNFIATVSELSMEELRLAKETTEGIKVGYNERLSALKELLKKGLITEQQFALRKKELNADLADTIIASLQGVAKEGSAISRGLFVFEKALAVRKALIAIIEGTAETAKIGFPQNIPLLIGFAAQVAGLIGALKGVAAPEPPKFARGVIGLQGAGTTTSDSIDAKLSRGESVLTARATKVFAPTLAAMERAVGNEPNVNIGKRRFAGGFIPQPAAALTPDYDTIIRQTLSAVGRIPVVVAEGDITEVQQNVRQIKVAGDL